MLGSAGDVHPFIDIGLALQRRGHDVQLFTNEYFEPLIRQAGLDFIAVGSREEYQAFTDDPALLHPWKSLSIVGEALVDKTLASVYHNLRHRVEPDDTVIVASTLALGARLVREKFDIPLVTVHLAPAALRSVESPPNLLGIRIPDRTPRWCKRALWWGLDKFLIDPALCPGLNAFRREIGLNPVSRVGLKWANSPDRIIGLFPSWFVRRPTDWPEHTYLTGFPLFDEAEIVEPAPGLDHFLDRGEPPIVFTLASWMRHGHRYFSEAAEVCARLGCRGILLSRCTDQIPRTLPQGVRHFPYVPLSRLLPRARAFVHQGGIGCCAQGLRAGIPQMVRPIAFDQFDNGDHIKALGVGDCLRAYLPAPIMADRLRRLIESSTVRARCQALAGKFMHGDPVSQTCDLIEGQGCQSCFQPPPTGPD